MLMLSGKLRKGGEMFWVISKARYEREKANLERRLAESDARSTCIAAVAFQLLQGATDQQREIVLAGLRQQVAERMDRRKHRDVPDEYLPVYRNELSRAMQLFLKNITDPT
jgi:hypothetical protein